MSEKLAINLYDLDRLPPEMRIKLLKGRLDLNKENIIDYEYTTTNINGEKEKRVEKGSQFTCDLLAAALVCDIIRSYDRSVGDIETRIYLNKGDGIWTKLSKNAILVVSGGKKLNPKYFDVPETILYKPQGK